jgi:hypothetical protein
MNVWAASFIPFTGPACPRSACGHWQRRTHRRWGGRAGKLAERFDARVTAGGWEAADDEQLAEVLEEAADVSVLLAHGAK